MTAVNTESRHIIASALATSSGMNLPISYAVANADLGRFSNYTSSQNDARTTVADIDYLAGETVQEKVRELVDITLRSLLAQLPENLQRLPLYLTVPDACQEHNVADWLEKGEWANHFSQIVVLHQSSIEFIHYCIQETSKHDAIMCIAVDSLLDDVEQLIEDSKVIGPDSPWGIIPAEGAAGLILTQSNVVETLNLSVESTVHYSGFDWKAKDRRGCLRLARRAASTIGDVHRIHTDMINLRAHVEDYGFALSLLNRGADGRQAQLTSVNEWWGTLGKASGLATLASFPKVCSEGNLGVGTIVWSGAIPRFILH